MACSLPTTDLFLRPLRHTYGMLSLDACKDPKQQIASEVVWGAPGELVLPISPQARQIEIAQVRDPIFN